MSQIKSKERVAERGEVFTAEREVNAMCDLVANECLRPDSRFLEPACGDGNFLAVILKRKLAELRRKYKKRESGRKHSLATRSSIALTSRSAVKTSPRSATLSLDFI